MIKFSYFITWSLASEAIVFKKHEVFDKTFEIPNINIDGGLHLNQAQLNKTLATAIGRVHQGFIPLGWTIPNTGEE